MIKKFLIAVLLISASILFAIFVVEWALRFTAFKSLLPYEGMPRGYFVPDKDIAYDIALNYPTSTHRFSDATYPVWSNNVGCFDRSFEGETPYIYLGGDSFAWGFAPFDSKWGVVLEKELGTRILKCGVPGTGTFQSLGKAEKTLKNLENPEVIILSYFGNDLSDDQSFPNSLVHEGRLIKNLTGAKNYEEAESNLSKVIFWSDNYCMLSEPQNPKLQRVKCFLTKHSILYSLVKNVAKSLISDSFLKNAGLVNKPISSVEIALSGRDEHFNNILSFRDLAKEKEAKFFMVLVPAKEDVYELTDSLVDMRTFLDQEKITYIDLTDGFREAFNSTREKDLYWPHDGHWNEKGNALAGELVTQFLEQNFLK